MARDPALSDVVATGVAQATPDRDFTVTVEVGGLSAGQCSQEQIVGGGVHLAEVVVRERLREVPDAIQVERFVAVAVELGERNAQLQGRRIRAASALSTHNHFNPRLRASSATVRVKRLSRLVDQLNPR